MENKKYNIGLDIGTTSVGWAVVESDTSKIIKKGKNRKSLWGVRLFEEATTAEERRNYRSSRRRYERRKQRIGLLQDEFKEEINKVDSNFFKKLQQSKYHKNDKENKTITINNEEKNYYKQLFGMNSGEYKTIYHLRNELINCKDKKDIRLIYLAIHHIIKYRGNFLYNKKSFNVNDLNIKDKLISIFNSISSSNFDDIESIIDFNEFEKIILIPSKNDVKIKIKELLENIFGKDFTNNFSKLIVGNKFSISKLLNIESENDIEINFENNSFDEKYDDICNLCSDKIEILNELKELYDMIFLKKLFKGNDNLNISSLMIDKYNTHHEDLQFLKEVFKTNKKEYYKFFKTSKDGLNLCEYDKYIKNNIDYDTFINEINKVLPQLLETKNDNNLTQKYINKIKPRIENKEFLPKITSVDNGRYPYQLNKEELIKIIENQGKYYSFLLNKTNDNEYKLVKLLEFRIPYYVGPLNENSSFAWLKRNIENVKITPYNFDEVIDKENTAEQFIKRMISHCTYLLNEYALANNSILYSKFKVLNELKQIQINSEKLTIDMQHKIFNELFLTTSGTITDTKFKNYLNTLKDYAMYDGYFNITGYSADKKFANNMQSYIDFFGENGIFNNTNYTEEDAETIIEWITIFEDKDILKTKIEKTFPNLNDNQIKKIINKKYKGWGSLSKKLLLDLTVLDKKTNTYKSIMDLMYETKYNFMQIINDEKYNFESLINKENNISNINKLDYEMLVSPLATSPANKRGIWQALKVLDEIINYMGYEPENIIIETAKSDDIKQRKDDRKNYLLKIYESCKESINEYNKLHNELKSLEKIDTEKLFLYFIQEGKCLYSGRPLNIENLNEYEVDHILPRTLIKDDSIDNKALVYRECNQNKGASLILPNEYRCKERIEWWQHLKNIELITAKKYNRLIRYEYKEEEIMGFINRQLVETRQITKHVTNIINNLYKNTNVIYIKANISHNYREKYELFKFRELNDYHHAHDAYLAAVLGYYNEKYIKFKINNDILKDIVSELFKAKNYKSLKYGFIINSLDNEVANILNEKYHYFFDNKTGELLFDTEKFNKLVENTLYRNDILISKKTEIRTGQLFKEKIYKHNDSKINSAIPIAKNMPPKIYGFYTNMNFSYLSLIKIQDKQYLIGIPVMIKTKNQYLKYIANNYKTDINNIKIIKEKIPFNIETIYKDHKVLITGANELMNNEQLIIKKELLKKWKYTLNLIFNNKPLPLIEKVPVLTKEELNLELNEIINYLINKSNRYPLYKDKLNKIKNIGKIYDLDIEEKAKTIKNIFVMLQASKTNANLENIGLTVREGRLNFNNIEHSVLIYKSTTGIKEKIYEF